MASYYCREIGYTPSKTNVNRPAPDPAPRSGTCHVNRNSDLDLVDVTADLIQMGDDRPEQEAARDGTREFKRLVYSDWKIRASKVTSSVAVYAGVAYLYHLYALSPLTAATPDDRVRSRIGKGSGTALRGGLSYRRALPMISTRRRMRMEIPSDRGKGKKDRSKLIGTSMPSAPVIAVLSGGAKLFVG